MVSECSKGLALEVLLEVAATRETAAEYHELAMHGTMHLKRGGFVSCQAQEMCDAILEGYPKSKKQFFVSGTLFFSPGFLPWYVSLTSLPATQEEAGIETDEDYNVTLPDP
jgi:hypothetical protein